MNRTASGTLAGALATIIGSAIWGLFWLPVQHIDQLGVSGLWAIVFIQLAAVVPALIFLVLAGESRDLKNFDNWAIGACMGLSTMLYFTGILLSDVVRVIFLFYTLPVWTILWNALLFRKAPIPRHYVVILIALLGLWLLLSGGESWVPKPQNIGDWCGLIAGAAWGLGLTLLENRQTSSAKASSFATFVFAFAFALIAVLITKDAAFNSLNLESASASIPLAIFVGMGLQYPILYLVVWGGQRLSAPTAALLTMSEILAATISATLIIGNVLNSVAWAGGAIIVFAAMVDIFGELRATNRQQTSKTKAL